MFTAEMARQWIKESAKKIESNKEQLTDLDQVLGDGDHGLNMTRGFKAAVEQLNEETDEPGKVLKGVGTSLLSKIGGASGPLYGTLFMKAGNELEGTEVQLSDLSSSFRVGVDGMKKRGKAEREEKTMIDLLEPVIELMEEKGNELTPAHLIDKAKEALEHVKEYEAKKGRAAYYKEKSKGKQDAGAQSSYYLIESLATVLDKDGEA
ncbi:dihydroxyacetone kinase subunit DhaL [Guptibacillus hwajinpoensis]|uniref:dihydroxyacetone kinase subunit DhaL n=1 Tax=Guptibacillus hwajinpoensis TaxID=208199 RepID=UPI001CFDE302|nr:dihydroxyacetone kinase subunit DhaL [Pseudalkalibacillus hwajinpoensis]WLR58738.1 dihydroxyacetone kinase subunit DhaL [Pseudalkalibacillus hwajinpoensis]